MPEIYICNFVHQLWHDPLIQKRYIWKSNLNFIYVILNFVSTKNPNDWKADCLRPVARLNSSDEWWVWCKAHRIFISEAICNLFLNFFFHHFNYHEQLCGPSSGQSQSLWQQRSRSEASPREGGRGNNCHGYKCKQHQCCWMLELWKD